MISSISLSRAVFDLSQGAPVICHSVLSYLGQIAPHFFLCSGLAVPMDILESHNLIDSDSVQWIRLSVRAWVSALIVSVSVWFSLQEMRSGWDKKKKKKKGILKSVCSCAKGTTLWLGGVWWELSDPLLHKSDFVKIHRFRI